MNFDNNLNPYAVGWETKCHQGRILVLIFASISNSSFDHKFELSL